MVKAMMSDCPTIVFELSVGRDDFSK